MKGRNWTPRLIPEFAMSMVIARLLNDLFLKLELKVWIKDLPVGAIF